MGEEEVAKIVGAKLVLKPLQECLNIEREVLHDLEVLLIRTH